MAHPSTSEGNITHLQVLVLMSQEGALVGPRYRRKTTATKISRPRCISEHGNAIAGGVRFPFHPTMGLAYALWCKLSELCTGHTARHCVAWSACNSMFVSRGNFIFVDVWVERATRRDTGSLTTHGATLIRHTPAFQPPKYGPRRHFLLAGSSVDHGQSSYSKR